MTEIQMIHRREQVDAAREEFIALWDAELRDKAIGFGFVHHRQLFRIQHVAWHAYRTAKFPDLQKPK